MKKLKGSAALIILVVILLIVAICAIGTTIYFWQKGKTTTISQELSTPSTTTSTTAPSSQSQTQQTPKEVVELFMNSTLGTLPNAKLNTTLAQSYLTDSLKAQNTGESWVPQFYKIQDGPVSAKYISENISGDTATVRYDPSWGETSLGWTFILKKEKGQWLIDEFRNDAQ